MQLIEQLGERNPQPSGETRPTILLVDDNVDVREALRFVIESGGYAVAEAWNGQEALRYLHGNGPPRLILLDLKMPIMDGWTFLEERRKVAAFQQVPVIVISASLIGENPLADVDLWIPKPVYAELLLAAIDRYR